MCANSQCIRSVVLFWGFLVDYVIMMSSFGRSPSVWDDNIMHTHKNGWCNFLIVLYVNSVAWGYTLDDDNAHIPYKGLQRYL